MLNKQVYIKLKIIFTETLYTIVEKIRGIEFIYIICKIIIKSCYGIECAVW